MTTDAPKDNVIPLRRDPTVYEPRRHSDFVSWFNAGFHELVPVTPPLARIAEGSRLSPENLGKAPGLKTDVGTWTGFPHWRHHRANRNDVERWRSWLCNAGISCYSVAGLDLDIHSVAAQDAIDLARRVALQNLGPAPARVGMPPKQLLMYRVSQPVRKMMLHFRRPGSSDKPYIIEVLGAGQQFVIEGTHPSGNLYTWDRDPRHGGIDKLAEVTPEQLERFMQTMGGELVTLGYEIVVSGHGRIDRDEVDQDVLVNPDLDMIERAVQVIPNDNDHFADRIGYIRIGIAIKAAFRDDPDRGLEIFREWAKRWKGNVKTPGNTDEQIEKDWNSLKSPFALGADYLISLAYRFGHEVSSEFNVISLFDDLTLPLREQFLVDSLNWCKKDLVTLGPKLAEADERWPGILDEIETASSVTHGLTRADLDMAIATGLDISRLELWPGDVIRNNVKLLLTHDEKRELPFALAAYVSEWHQRNSLQARSAVALFGGSLAENRGRAFDTNRIVLFVEAAMAVYGSAIPLVEFPPAAAVLKTLAGRSPLAYDQIRRQACALPDWNGRGFRVFDQTVLLNAYTFDQAMARSGDDAPRPDDYRPTFRFERQNMEVQAFIMLERMMDTGTTLENLPIFRYGDQLVTVVNDARTLDKPTSGILIKRHNVHSLRFKMMHSVRFQMRAPKGDSWVDASPPDDFVQMVLNNNLELVRPLNGIVNTPIIGPGGYLLKEEGYDERVGLFAHFDGRDFNVEGIDRSREAADRAYHWFSHVLLDGFEFASRRDQAVAVSAALTLVVRRLIEQSPAYTIMAPIQASGKTTLVQVICNAILGKQIPAASWPRTDEEFGKRIMGLLLQGMSAVLLDNLDDGMLVNSSELSMALTSATYKGRLLGGNIEVTVPTNTLWFLTGNGLTISRDLATRMLTCTLEPTTENPYRRIFKRVDPAKWGAKHQVTAVRHALTIILAYLEAQKHGASIPRSTRFEEWDGLVRQPLLWLFNEDPEMDIGRQFERSVVEDRATNPRESVLKALRNRFRVGNRFTLEDVRTVISDEESGNLGPAGDLNGNVRAAFDDMLGDRRPNRSNLSRMIRQVIGRVVDGTKLVAADESTESISYVFIEVSC